MIGRVNTIRSDYKGIKSHQMTTLLITTLLSFIVLTNLSGFHEKIKKTLNYSSFTLPPLITIMSSKNCNSNAPSLEAGIKCFENKHYNQAKTIFNQLRKSAIKEQNQALLFKSMLYLAFISIDQGETNSATKRIKHLFFLRTHFTLKPYHLKNTNYLKLFKKINQQGRNAGEKEIDDISGIEFIRVTSCLNKQCKNGVWQPIGHNTSKNRNINNEIACSIKGNCDKSSH
jgi:hypothetical protein